MKVLDYNKLDAMLGLEYNGEEIDTFEALEKQVVNAVPIPDNATNGDVIKAMFPNVEFKNDHQFTVWGYINGGDCIVKYDIDWWNAPYKKGAEE